MATHGHFHWNELMTHDVDKAKALYGDAVGWQFQEMPMPDGSKYTLCMVGEEVVGGMYPSDSPDAIDEPDHWMSYVAVEDVDAAVKKAIPHGIKMLRDIFDVPGVGRIALLQQPDGAMIGWMTPAENG